MEKIAGRLLPGVSYRQVVLTLPGELRQVFYNHPQQSALYSGFIYAGYTCLEALIRELLRCNTLKIAAIVFIHTHGRDGQYHPHLHVILAEGGFNPQTSQWISFSYLPLSPLRIKWQQHLLSFISDFTSTLGGLIERLRMLHPKGFYTYPGNEKKVPVKHYKSLIRYLTKYLASPPIGISRITAFAHGYVSYYYQSHKTKRREYVRVEAETFIGRMVQHILPKGFQRLRYYGLQATASFKKWYEIIAQVAGGLVDRMMTYVSRLRYSEFFNEVAGRNPLQCQRCGGLMELVKLFHPSRGFFYDIFAPDL